jgi:phosphoglycolate phosphatase-like HAD superfamily hydrolase
MTRTIFFDMDGTIADLYGVNGWLDSIIERDAKPYKEAKVMHNMQALARVLNRLQRQGNKVAIISWLAKDSTEDYDAKVAQAKREWLSKHLASVHFDEINIVKYGTAKQTFAHTTNDILFDDEEQNRNNWTGEAHNVHNIINVLKSL